MSAELLEWLSQLLIAQETAIPASGAKIRIGVRADRVVVKQEHLLQTSRDEADQDNGASGQNSRGDCPDQKKLLARFLHRHGPCHAENSNHTI